MIERYFGRNMIFPILVIMLFCFSGFPNLVPTLMDSSPGTAPMRNSVNVMSDIDTDLLPQANISLSFEGPPGTSSIIGTIEFGFGGWWDEADVVGVGYSEISIVTQHSEMYQDVVGIGCAVMHDYVFAYVGEQELFDCWKDGQFASEYIRNNWPWNSGNYIGGSYMGRINETTLAQLTSAGCIIQYENLTAFYEDGSSAFCGPRYVAIGVNFTRSGNSWSFNRILTPSDPEGVTIESTGIVVTLNELPVLRLQVLTLLYGIPMIIVLVFFLWWRKQRTFTA